MKKRIVILLLFMSLFVVGCSNEEQEAESEETETKPIEIYLVRHGKTYFNTTDQVQGWSDTPLTEEGVQDAVKSGKGLKDTTFDFTFSSDLGRARSTAKIILEENDNTVPEIQEDERLREVFYGSYEGKTNFEIMKPLFDDKNIDVTEETWGDKWDDLKAVATDEWMIDQYHENDPTHEAENYEQVSSRTKEAISSITEEVENNGGGNVLIVTHGDQIGVMLSELFPEESFPSIPNLGLTKITYDSGEFELEEVGTIDYLEE
jgi:broad specificity phosphatase PhoE